MSVRRLWPEGVPPLPNPPTETFRLMPLQRREPSDPARLWMKAESGRLEDFLTSSDAFVVRAGDRILFANAAARALGIVPDGEADA